VQDRRAQHIRIRDARAAHQYLERLKQVIQVGRSGRAPLIAVPRGREPDRRRNGRGRLGRQHLAQFRLGP
jgi:hypothetical protein